MQRIGIDVSEPAMSSTTTASDDFLEDLECVRDDCCSSTSSVNVSSCGQRNGSTSRDAVENGQQKRRNRVRKHSRKHRGSGTSHQSHHPQSSSSSSSSTTVDYDPSTSTNKLFVGQLPININEDQLLSVLTEFGRVVKLKILRDEVTGLSQRCCFVTFARPQSAKNALCALHNSHRIPGAVVILSVDIDGELESSKCVCPLQVKFADSAANSCRQRKLFVGMISKDLGEADLIEMFTCYGRVEECCVVRDQTNGQSKGCAFVTFTDRHSAASAIAALHHSLVMPCCTAPIVVKLADTRPTKIIKWLQSQLQAATQSNQRHDDCSRFASSELHLASPAITAADCCLITNRSLAAAYHMTPTPIHPLVLDTSSWTIPAAVPTFRTYVYPSPTGVNPSMFLFPPDSAVLYHQLAPPDSYFVSSNISLLGAV